MTASHVREDVDEVARREAGEGHGPEADHAPPQLALVARRPRPQVDRDDAQTVEGVVGDRRDERDLAEALPAADGYALDISREAVRQACRRSKQLTWLVASMARVPLADASCQLLASVFSPLDWQEAKRLLAPGGGLLRMGPTGQHLMELRQKLYDEVRDYDDEKHLSLVPDGMQLAHSETLTFTLTLDTAQARADLLAMTPHGWRASAERRAAVIDAELQVTVSIRYDWFQRASF